MTHYHWSAAIGWGILAAIVIVYVVLFDLHAYLTHGTTLSGQFHDWLFSPSIAPFIFGGSIGIIVGLMFHFFQYHGK